MAEYRDQTLSGEIALDGNTFINVDFDGAELIYRGGASPAFSACRFNTANFSFRDQGANTLAFLNAMAPANTNMREVVLGLLPGLKD